MIAGLLSVDPEADTCSSANRTRQSPRGNPIYPDAIQKPCLLQPLVTDSLTADLTMDLAAAMGPALTMPNYNPRGNPISLGTNRKRSFPAETSL